MPQLTVVRLKYIQKYKDRHGKVRHYLRVPGHKRIALPDASDLNFLSAYQTAIASLEKPEPTRSYPPKSFSALVEEWYGYPAFTALRSTTQVTYRRILEYMRAQPYALEPVISFKPQHVRKIIAKRAATPARANHILRMFRMLFQHAAENGWREDNPTIGVRRLKTRDTGARSWTDDEIATYESRWGIGTRERLGFALLLYTGQRRSDVVHMGPAARVGDTIKVRQIKTGAELIIPIHPRLREVLDSWTGETETYLATRGGARSSSNGFYNQFIEWRNEAGLPAGLAPHGLRKAAARRLAEAGCTPHQIAAVTGHQTLAEVERYTRAVSQQKLARQAISALQTDDNLSNQKE